MRLLLINTLLPPISTGGAEESVYELADDLSAMGHDVAVACLGPTGPTVRELNATFAIFRIYDDVVNPYLYDRTQRTAAEKALYHAGEVFRPRLDRFLRHVMQEWRPDVVNTHTVGGFGLSSWRCVPHATPLVHTLRDYYLLCLNVRTFRHDKSCVKQCLDCRAFRTPYRFSLRTPDFYVGVSQATIDHHADFNFPINSTRSVVIPNSPRRLATHKRLEPKQQGITFGVIGRMESYKGYRVVVEAFKDLPSFKAHLLLAGAGEARDRGYLESTVASDDRIEYVGRIPADLFYSRVDVVCVPSLWPEPFGRVAYEAALAGKTVAVSATGGLPEAVRGFPQAEVVHNFENPESWLRFMEKCLDASRLGLTLHGSPHELAAADVGPRSRPAEAYDRVYKRVHRRTSGS